MAERVAADRIIVTGSLPLNRDLRRQRGVRVASEGSACQSSAKKDFLVKERGRSSSSQFTDEKNEEEDGREERDQCNLTFGGQKGASILWNGGVAVE